MLAALLQATPVQDTPAAAAKIRSRLAAYEVRLAAGRAETGELAAIAKDVLQSTAASRNAHAVIQTCSSSFFADETCTAKLWEIARRTTAAFEERARAAAALARRGDKEAAGYLLQIVKPAPAARLAGVADALLTLPAERSVPLLEPLLQSKEPAAQTAACRILAKIDSAESRQAVRAFVAAAPRGTGPWHACMVASARLGDPEAHRMLRPLTHYMSGDDLVAAAEGLLPEDQDLAVSFLMQVTRESRGFPQLEAAERLAPFRPEIAADIMEYALASPEPELRAAALEVHRTLRLDPSKKVRDLLVDSNPLVQLRAGETVLAWEARRKSAGVQGPAAPRRR